MRLGRMRPRGVVLGGRDQVMIGKEALVRLRYVGGAAWSCMLCPDTTSEFYCCHPEVVVPVASSSSSRG